MDINKLLGNIATDTVKSENELGGVAASCATKELLKFWHKQDVGIEDIQSDLDHAISDLINLKLRLHIVADTNTDALPDYEDVMDKASTIVDSIK
jgi:hypothetical protein